MHVIMHGFDGRSRGVGIENVQVTGENPIVLGGTLNLETFREVFVVLLLIDKAGLLKLLESMLVSLLPLFCGSEILSFRVLAFAQSLS